MSTIRSRIAGTFEGAQGQSIYTLDNGQVWQQYKYFYKYKYSYRPRVTIESRGYRGVMLVDGFSREIHVQRLK